MFRRIFDKHKGTAEREQSLRPSAPAPSADADIIGGVTPDQMVDDAFLALARELSGLGAIEVSKAAKERGWASLQRELERRPIRATGTPATAKASRVRSWRWAIASVGAAVAVIAGVLGAYGGGAFTTTVAENEHPTTLTSVASSDTTQPDTTGTTLTSTTGPQTSGTTVSPNTTGSHPGTTGTQPTSPSTSGPGTSRPTTSTSQPTTRTTQPTPSTTPETEMASKERSENAITAAEDLATRVVSGDLSGARVLIDPQAQQSLVWMKLSLTDPNGWTFVDSQTLADGTVRVTLGIQDHVANSQGIVVEKILRFAIKVRITAKGAVVTAINAG